MDDAFLILPSIPFLNASPAVTYSGGVPLLLLALLLLLPLALALMMPFVLFQRYRVGTARRLARPWAATFNVMAMTFSSIFFLIVAAITSAWIPNAFTSAVSGMAVGAALGIIGLWLSRWEATPRTLHYTPNRWLVLIVTLAVTVRVMYGFWRGWAAMRLGADDSFIAAFGVAGSLAVAAIVIGYYLAYGFGVRRRIRMWEKRRLRTMN